MLADGIDTNAHGDRIVIVGRRRISVPRGLSRDHLLTVESTFA